MKWALPLVMGLAGGLAGGLLAHALRPEPAPARVMAVAPERPALDRAAVEEIVRAALDRRLPGVERGMERAASNPVAAPAAPEEREGSGEGTGEAAAPSPDATVEAVVRALKGRKLGPDETGRLFGWLTLHKERTAEVIAALQKEVAADPTNPELQVALATAYVADLTNNTMPGPQQGIVWMKASAAYDAALKLDPGHWTARFGKAFGTSMIPEFLGQRPEAIRQFEDLLGLQKQRAPEPHFADTYFRLGTLYKDAGNMEKAREVWAAGLALFPDNEELKGTIEASTKK